MSITFSLNDSTASRTVFPDSSIWRSGAGLVRGGDLGHVVDDVAEPIDRFGAPNGDGSWTPFDPTAQEEHQPLKGPVIEMSGEYSRMRERSAAWASASCWRRS
jgi:hypothetical protein